MFNKCLCCDNPTSGAWGGESLIDKKHLYIRRKIQGYWSNEIHKLSEYSPPPTYEHFYIYNQSLSSVNNQFILSSGRITFGDISHEIPNTDIQVETFTGQKTNFTFNIRDFQFIYHQFGDSDLTERKKYVLRTPTADNVSTFYSTMKKYFTEELPAARRQATAVGNIIQTFTDRILKELNKKVNENAERKKQVNENAERKNK
jgi:hypothetical protein